MKKIYSIIVLLVMTLIAGASLNSCDDNLPATNRVQPLSANTDTISKNGAKKETTDSILSKFDARIHTIGEKLDSVGSIVDANVRKVNVQVSELQKDEKWIWTSIGLCAVALILCLICCKMYLKLRKVVDQQYEDINNQRQEMQDLIFSPKTTGKYPTQSEFDSLKRRVSMLETKMSQSTDGPRIMPIPPSKTYTPTNSSKHGYFEFPIQDHNPYFMELLDSRNSDVRFEVETKGCSGTFKPLDSALGSIVSTDAMRSAIEFDGNIPKMPTKMTVVSLGKVEQKDGRWYIKGKAKVRLS